MAERFPLPLRLYEQGARLKNLEFIQYHPTTIETPQKRMLITEAACGEGEFFGAVFANESYLIATQSAKKPIEAVKEYKKHFGAGCSKALSCQSVCPVGIETLTSILKMNRK